MAPKMSHASSVLTTCTCVAGNTGIFGVTAVELPPHSAHRGDDDIALVELPSWRFRDKADRLYAQDTRQLDAGRMALPREQFGAVEPEGLNLDQHFAALRRGDRAALDLQNLRPTRFVHHHGFHSGHHWSPLVLVRRGRWVGSGEAGARDLPGAVDLLEHEELLISF